MDQLWNKPHEVDRIFRPKDVLCEVFNHLRVGNLVHLFADADIIFAIWLVYMQQDGVLEQLDEAMSQCDLCKITW